MLFTLELEGSGKSFRLQKDGSWRDAAKDNKLRGSDYATDNAAEITALSTSKPTMDLEGITYDIDPHMWPTTHDHLYFSSKIFRQLYPIEPTIEQLIAVISLGDDSINNVLILNVNGKFELRQSPPFNHLINDPTIVVRHAIYVAGNRYVGAEAENNKRFIKEEFKVSLELWVQHLKHHISRIFIDLHSNKSLEMIYEDLKQVCQNWKPDY